MGRGECYAIFRPDSGGAGGGCGPRGGYYTLAAAGVDCRGPDCAPPAHALELNAELDALCAAARELAVCRAGWLYFCGTDAPLPAAVPRGLLQGTVLTFLRGVLRSEGRAVVRLLPQGDSAVLALQGGSPARMPGDLPALLHRCGPYVTAAGARYAAAVRLALSPTLPLTPLSDADALVLDRYSPPRVYLQGFCVEDVE